MLDKLKKTIFKVFSTDNILKQTRILITKVSVLIKQTLSFVTSLLKIFSTFVCELYSLLSPALVVITSAVSPIISYRLFIRTLIGLGFASKIVLAISAATPSLALPALVLTFAAEYCTFISSTLLFIISLIQNITNFVITYKEKAATVELETKVFNLKRLLEDAKLELSQLQEKLSEQESEYKAILDYLKSSLEEIQKKSENGLTLEKVNSILSILSTLMRFVRFVYDYASGSGAGNNDEIITLLKSLLSIVEQLQKSELTNRNKSEAEEQSSQLTGGNTTNLDEE
jgi:hypothetical protein